MVQRSTFLHANHVQHLNLSVSESNLNLRKTISSRSSSEKIYITEVIRNLLNFVIEKYLKCLGVRNLLL